MAKSIIQTDRTHCFLCERNSRADYYGLDEHHVYGAANRDLSEKYGLKVYICHNQCHMNGVHKNAKLNNALKSAVQKKAMAYYHWSENDFRKIFGKSYL